MKKILAIILALSLLALCGCGAPTEQSAEQPSAASTEVPTEAPTEQEIPTAPVEKSYTVTVIDTNDSPVAGVSIQVAGNIGVTDETGVATFALEVGEYAVEILELPFGYSFRDTQTEFAFEEDVTYLTIYVALDDGDFVEEDVADNAPVDDDVFGEDFDPEI